MPNRLAASRWLRPSTWQASRTRRYRSTVYILPPSISKKDRRLQVAEFYSARGWEIPPLPWTNLSPPFSLLGKIGVPQACVSAFENNYDCSLGERLLRALEAGFVAGSAINPLRSASLLVVHRESWPLIDLRVDYHSSPIVELRKAWRVFEPEAMDFVHRAVDPDNAPQST